MKLRIRKHPLGSLLNFDSVFIERWCGVMGKGWVYALRVDGHVVRRLWVRLSRLNRG